MFHELTSSIIAGATVRITVSTACNPNQSIPLTSEEAQHVGMLYAQVFKYYIFFIIGHFQKEPAFLLSDLLLDSLN